MQERRRDLIRELADLCRSARDRGLTVPEIDALGDVNDLMEITYPVRHLVRIGRHTIIRSFLREVDKDGVRTHVAIVQEQLIFDLPLEGDEDRDALPTVRNRRARVYEERQTVLRQPNVAREALRECRSQVQGTVKAQPVLADDLKIELMAEIDNVFDRMASRLAG